MKEQEDSLRQAAAVFDNTTEGLLITDATTKIKAVNPSFTAVTGYTIEDLKDKTPKVLNSGRQDKAFYEDMWKSLLSVGKWRGEIWNRRKNGEIYPELLGISAVKDSQGNTLSYVAVFSDISKIKAAQDDLDFLAHHDWLTNLPNRLMFQSRLRHAMSRLDQGKRLAILLIDLDRFKDVNDSYGHPLGDEVLQLSAVRMFEKLSERDTLARLGGDEFIVLIEDLDFLEKAGRIAQELLTAIAEPSRLTRNINFPGQETYNTLIRNKLKELGQLNSTDQTEFTVDLKKMTVDMFKEKGLAVSAGSNNTDDFNKFWSYRDNQARDDGIDGRNLVVVINK
jgi:diguanylate cyclase (GGDEF)-like protein/PAS domain S-box-containing protein